MDTDEITIQKIVGFPWNDPGTDLENELPTPVASPIRHAAPTVGNDPSKVHEQCRDDFDNVGMISISKVLLSCRRHADVDFANPRSSRNECVGDHRLHRAGYTSHESCLGFTEVRVPSGDRGSKVLVPQVFSHLGGVLVGGDVRPSSCLLPSPRLPPTEVAPPPCVTEDTLDDFLPTISSPGGESSRSPEREDMTGQPATEIFVVEAAVTPPPAVGVPTDPSSGLDLVQEGPFEGCDVTPTSGQGPWVLNNLLGCQYRMTSYDDRDTRTDMDPACDMHLHDPRMMEYLGAPESARLLGRTPDYWLKHMGREKTLAVDYSYTTMPA